MYRLRFTTALLLALLGTAAPARQSPGGLDPETWEEIRQDIDRRRPDLDPETRRDILRRIENTPKVRCTIEAVTVYTNGIVYRGTLACELPDDCRMGFLGRSLSLVHMARLTDRDGTQWVVPPLENHYHFDRLTQDWTLLLPKGKRVSFEQTDTLERPQLTPAKPAKRPTELSYSVASYSNAYSDDLNTRKTVYLFGRGKTQVAWKDGPVPKDATTRVLETPGPAR